MTHQEEIRHPASCPQPHSCRWATPSRPQVTAGRRLAPSGKPSASRAYLAEAWPTASIAAGILMGSMASDPNPRDRMIELVAIFEMLDRLGNFPNTARELLGKLRTTLASPGGVGAKSGVGLSAALSPREKGREVVVAPGHDTLTANRHGSAPCQTRQISNTSIAFTEQERGVRNEEAGRFSCHARRLIPDRTADLPDLKRPRWV